jgi:plasmid replication initiation protein
MSMKTKNLTVYKANEVVEAGYRLSLNEQRVVLACIGQVDSAKQLLLTDQFELSAKAFAKLFAVSNEAAYMALKDVAESLFKRYVVIDKPFPDDPAVTSLKTHWISSITYLEDAGKIRLRFAQDILPYLGALRGAFTRYRLEHVGKMTSVYAIRLYELLVQWQGIGRREIEIAWLKEKLEISDQYAQMCDFKKRVLEPAVSDINTHSNLQVSWSQRKTGRVVSHLIFTFSEKTNGRPAEAKTPRLKESYIGGVAKSEIERQAKPGETYEDAAARIARRRKNTRAATM